MFVGKRRITYRSPKAFLYGIIILHGVNSFDLRAFYSQSDVGVRAFYSKVYKKWS